MSNICHVDPHTIVAIVIKKLEKMDKDKTTFNLEEFVKTFYSDRVKGTGNPGMAASMTRIVPESIVAAFDYFAITKKRALSNRLQDENKVDLTEARALSKEFKDFKNVLDYVKDIDEELAKATQSNVITHPTPKKGRPTKADVLDRSIRDIIRDLEIEYFSGGMFEPKPLDFNTTTGQEAEEAVNGKYTNRRNPSKIVHYNTLKKILNAFQASKNPTAENLTYDGHTGFKLAAGIKEDVDTRFGKHFVTITDNDNIPILFNEDGSINKNGNGKEVYFSLRMPNEVTNKKLIADVVMRYREKLSRLLASKTITKKQLEEEVAKFEQDFTISRQQEIDLTNKILDTLKESPTAVVSLDITGGSKGYINPKKTPLSDVWDTLKSNEIYSIKYNTVTGRPYITLNNVQEPIELRGNPISVKSDIMKSIIDVLTKPVMLNGKLMSNADKVAYTKQFLFSKVNIGIDGATGKITLAIHGKAYDVASSKAPAQLLKAFTSTEEKVYINVNGDLIKSGTYEFIEVNDKNIGTSSNVNYITELLLPYLDIIAQPNDDGEIHALNGYFTWEPSNQIIEAVQPKYTASPEVSEISKKVEDYDSNPDDLDASRALSKRVTAEQDKKALDWWNDPNNKLAQAKNKDGKPLIPFNVLRNIANSNAWAKFNIAGITLYNGSDNTHIYHEAWHAFSQLYLTKAEKTALYDELKKRPGTFKVPITRTDAEGNKRAEMVEMNFKDATYRQIEEYIAEEFRSFAISKGEKTPKGAKMRSLFQRIWDYLKTLFTGVKTEDVITQPNSVDSLSEIFNNLYVGNINNYTPLYENMMFSSLRAEKDGVTKATDPTVQLNYAESKLLSNSIDGLVSEYINTTGGAYATTRIFLTEKNRNKLFDYVKSKMIQELDTLSNDINSNRRLAEGDKDKWDDQTLKAKDRNVFLINYALTNWGEHNNMKDDSGMMGFYKTHSEFADMINTPIQKEDGSLQVNSEEDEKAQQGGLRFNIKAANESSVKDLADGMVLYLVRSLIAVDSSGDTIKNELGFPKLASFPNTWNSLVRTIGGSSSPQELYNKLLKFSKEGHPIFRQVLTKLGRPELQIELADGRLSNQKSVSEQDMWLKFWQTFNMPRIPLIAFIANKDKNGNITYKVGRASADYFKTIRKWESDFSSAPEGRYVEKGTGKTNKGLNYLKLDNVVHDFIKEVPVNKVIKYEVRSGSAFDFLRAIGIKLTDNQAIRKEVENNIDVVNYIANHIAMARNAGTELDQTLLTEPMKLLKSTFTGKRLPVSGTVVTIEKVGDVSGRLMTLAEIETEYSDEYSSLSRVTPSGDKQYEQSLNSTMTGVTDALNKAERFQDLYTEFGWQYMEYLDFKNNPAARTSVLLNSLFVLDTDPATDADWGRRRPGASIDMQNLSGAMIIDFDYKDNGVAHSGMSMTDKFITDFHSVLSGGYIGQPQHGSKSTYIATKMSAVKTYTGKVDNSLYISTADCLVTPGTNYSKGIAEAYKIAKGYIQSEIEKIQMVKEDPFYKTVRGFENADKFVLFDDNFLSKSMKSALLKPEFIAAMKANPKGLIGALAQPEFQDMDKQLEKAFKKYFMNLTADYTNNILSKTAVYKKGKFLYDAIQPKVYEDILLATGRYTPEQINIKLERDPITKAFKRPEEIEPLRQAAMKSFALNAWIHKVEMMTLYYGDASQYNHAKEEFNKRNSTFGSNGYIFATDDIAASYINNGRNSKNEVDFMRTYTADAFAKGLIKTNPRKEYDGTMNTAIIKDNERASVYYTNLHDMFKRGLETQGLKGDALKEALYGRNSKGVLGTFDKPQGGLMKPYSKMTEGDGQGWVSFDAYRIMKRLEGKWSPAQENAYQDVIAGKQMSPKEIVELFPVYKVQYAGNLKNTRGKATLPITAIHKFSLFPMIPTAIKNTPMEQVHNKMMEEGIDYALFQSGSKLSSITATDDREADSIFKDEDTSMLDFKPHADGNVFTKNTIFMRNLKNQLDLNTYYKGTTNFSTQLRGMLNSGLIENGLPVDFMKGKPYQTRHKAWNKLNTGEQLKESNFFKLSRTFEKTMGRIVQLNLEKLTENVGWKYDRVTKKPIAPLNEEGNPDYTSMVDFIRKELVKQGFAKHEVDFIDVDPGTGELIRDLSTSFSAPKIERLLMSIVNNRIVKQNLTGEALVQLAVTFTQNTKFRRPTEDELKTYGTSGLPFYQWDPKNPTKACKIKISLQGDFENLFNTKYFKKNADGTLSEDGTIAHYDTIVETIDGKQRSKRVLNFDKSLAKLNEMVREDQWLDIDENRKKITLTGVRIPVQGLNSMEFMEVYEFLPPIAGPVIILPSEIVAKSGGDFDVDKLTTYFPHITKNGTWVNGDTYGDNWKEEIDGELKVLDSKLQAYFKDTLGAEATLDNIKKKLKGDIKAREAAIKVLKAKRDEAFDKSNVYFDAIKNGFAEYAKTNTMPEDIKKLIKNEDQAGLLSRLAEYDKLDALQNKGNGIYEAYKAMESLEINELTKLINEEYEGKQDIQEVKSDDRFKTLLKEYTDLQDMKKHFIKSIHNKLIDDIVNILALKENAIPLLTPNSTHLTKPVADKMEPKVQSFDFKKSRMEGGERVEKGISGSRILEYDYNLNKQQNNIIGMGSLGISAIDNKYNPIFNAAGAHIMPKYTPTAEQEKEKPEELDVKVYLRHNTVPLMEKGKKIADVISLSSLRDKNNKNLISEIGSQLINGFVDVEKDAYIAFIQGNKEVTPMLSFLNKMGVPFEDAVAFVSNPLVRKYVEEQKILKGVLGDMIGKPWETGRVKARAKAAVWKEAGLQMDGNNIPNHKVRFEIMEKLLKDQKELTAENLDPLVDVTDPEAIKKNDLIKGAFVHYLYMEDLMQGYNDIKTNTNVDTKKTGSLFDAQLRRRNIEDLYQNSNMPSSIIKYIEEKSSISGFFVQQYATELWGGLFPLRNNEVVNEFLTQILKNYSLRTKIQNTTGYGAERLVSEFKNDLMSYLFINQIKALEVGVSGSYKGLRVDNTPVKYAEGINKAAFVNKVKDKPTIFVNIKNIEKEFANGSYLSTSTGPLSYSDQGLAPVNAGAFDNSVTGMKEYQNFVIEREYLRYSHPLNTLGANTEYNNELTKLYDTVQELEGESQSTYEKRLEKAAYENFLRNKALDNSFNFFKSFKAGDESYPKRMMDLIDKYPHLKRDYSVLTQFAMRGLKKKNEQDASHVTLLLKDARDLDAETSTQYYEDIANLSNPKVVKIPGSTIEIAEENNYINDFFKRLSLFAFQQSGMSSGTESAFTNILPYDQYSQIITEAVNKVSKQLKWKEVSETQFKKMEASPRTYITKKEKDGKYYGANIGFLQEFLQQFQAINATSNKSTRVGGKDWTQRLTPGFLKSDEVELPNLTVNPFLHRTATPGIFTMSSTATVDNKEIKLDGSSLRQIIQSNLEDTYFVFNNKRLGMTPDVFKAYINQFSKSGFQILDQDNLKITGEEGQKIVNDEIKKIEENFAAGKKIVFMEEGYAQPMIQESALNSPEITNVKKFTGQMNMSYGKEKRPGIISDTTFDAILKGERTATTRYDVINPKTEDELKKKKQFEYWKTTKVGDIITWKADDGRTVDVIVTKAFHPLKGSGKTPEQWSKLEGWSLEHFEKKVRPKIGEAWQMEYKLATPIQSVGGIKEVQSSTSVKIEPTDKIIFGHSTIGKSFLKKEGRTDFITLDDDYKEYIEKFIDKHRGDKTRQEYKGSKPKEYNDFMVKLYDKVKDIAKREGKTLLVSNTHILKSRMVDFDKVINISKEEFKKRLEQRGSFKDYDFNDWKSDIDATIGKVSSEKVITTDKYLSDLLPTQVKPVVKDQLNTTPKSEIFLYLSEQLADKFGYVNPGSEPVPSVMDILAKKQIVTQEDIDKRENECK